MERECRCKKCNKRISDLIGFESLMPLLQACQATEEHLVFNIDCPSCGEMNHFTIKYR